MNKEKTPEQKAAKRLYDREYNKKNKDKKLENSRNFYHKNKERTKEKRKESGKKWRLNNKDKIKSLGEKWRAENPNYGKEYREENKEDIKLKVNQYKIDNKEKVAQQRKDGRERNKAKIANGRKDYMRRHSEKVNKRNNEYRKERWKNDPAYKALTAMRGKFNKICKGIKIGKTEKKRFVEFFGCTEECFCNYIEMQFTPEMSWENWGTYWQLDHVIPISLCKGEKEIFKRLSHFTNLQPLIAFDNMSKADNIVPEYIGYDLFHRFKDLLPQDCKEPDFGPQWEEAILSSI